VSSSPREGDGRLRSKLWAFCEFARSLSRLSTCRRLQVGCIVVTPDLTEVLAIGYNGPPAGVDNDRCRATGPGDGHGGCGCIHGEANALVRLKATGSDLVMLTTDSPCEHCAGLVLNSKSVGAVVYDREYRDRTGLELLEAAGVTVVPRKDALRELST
jgi:dCMP deaminase